MSDSDRPSWFDPTGMEASIETAAALLHRQLRIVDLDGHELACAGYGTGEEEIIPLRVSGETIGHFELKPRLLEGDFRAPVFQAITTLQALAESRITIADLVETTARQWSELSIVHRSSELFRSDQSPQDLARSLLDQAERAFPGTSGAVRYQVGETIGELCTVENQDSQVRSAAAWSQNLDSAVLFASEAELAHHAFEHQPPSLPFLVVPLRARNQGFGALVLVADSDSKLGTEDLKLAEVFAGQAGLAFANLDMIEKARATDRLQRELSVASEIQASMHPANHIVLDWLIVAGHCTPASEVGGDAYLLVPQSASTMLAGVADVSGHGLSSALLMNSVVSQLAALAGQVESPGKLLQIANTQVCERAGNTGMFVTAVLLQLSKGGEVTVANAGHPPPLIVSSQGHVDVAPDSGFPLGIDEGETYTESSVTLPPNGFLVAYSDGLTEAKSPSGEMFGQIRLEKLLKHAVPEARSCDKIRDRILEELDDFSGASPQTDDVTLVVLRRTT